jgi:ribonuclease Z
MVLRTIKVLAALAVGAVVAAFGYLQGYVDRDAGREMRIAAPALAQGATVSPVMARGDRLTYYPNTEDLAPDEMRIISCGTGMPNQRPAQKATCWLVELGNGDKFLFDIGTGSSDNLAALMIPYEFLNKVFISHLHADHFGDLDALYVGGLISGRVGPLRVWGPSGSRPELGTAAAVEGLKKMLAWDIEGRKGRLPSSGQVLEVHEFDFMGDNHVVYQEDGVTIRSWPANHAIDGSVSYSLEWGGLKFVFSGDTYPNRWYVEYAQDADVAVHECFIAIPDLVDKMNFPVSRALEVGTQIHTPPPAFGKVMSLVKPRLAIAYHFFNDFDTAPKIMEGIRSTYDGPLSLADDMMVWNVTKDTIIVREIVFEEAVWPPPPAVRAPPVDVSEAVFVSDQVREGNLDVSDIINALYERANNLWGTDLKPNQ